MRLSCRVAAAPYPAYGYGADILPGGGCALPSLRVWCGFVAPVSAAPPGKRCTESEECVFILNRFFRRSDGRGGRITRLRLALRVVACGNAFSLRSNRTLVEASHPSQRLKNGEHGAEQEVCGGLGVMEEEEGFDDGRFTVCSLWPLGNPTRGNSDFEVKLEDGGGGRIIRRFAPHPSGRCLWQRCLAFARLEPSSKVLTLPDR